MTIEHDHPTEIYNKTLFGFWVYLMTDCILFATLFATYAVLHNGTYGGPTSQDLFSLPFALSETLVLLASSFTCGLAKLAVFANAKRKALLWFSITFLLGATFLGLELSEFRHLVHEGNSWERSAFLSAFFTLVGTHGLHISLGLLWMATLVIPMQFRDLTPGMIRRVSCLSFFWHFLDLVWIFIFTFVYLMGAS